MLTSTTAPSARGMLRALVLVNLCLLLAAPGMAQSWKGKGRLQGQIFDPEGEPVKGAQVTLHRGGADGPGPQAITSDKKGRWSYLGLAGGPWTIVIQTDEFLTSEGSVNVNEFQVAKPIRVDLKRPSEAQLANQAADLIDQGNALMQAGNYAEARAQYETALADTPEENKAAVLRGIAQTHSLEGNQDAAIAKLEESLALAPEDTSTLRLIIDLLLEQGRKEEADVYLAKMPEGEALDFTTRLNLGIDLYNQQDLEGAVGHFDQAVKDFPDQPDSYYYRGLAFLNQGKNPEALADFQKFLEVAPEDHAKRSEVVSFAEYLESQ